MITKDKLLLLRARVKIFIYIISFNYETLKIGID